MLTVAREGRAELALTASTCASSGAGNGGGPSKELVWMRGLEATEGLQGQERSLYQSMKCDHHREASLHQQQKEGQTFNFLTNFC